MTARPGVVVFDLDGTLIRDDSFSRFLAMLLPRRPLGRSAGRFMVEPKPRHLKTDPRRRGGLPDARLNLTA
jgi:phosphoserine phosphatase